MDVKGQIIVVTGAAGGIGAALCRVFAKAGAATVVAADIDEAGVNALRNEIGCTAFTCDVAVEGDIAGLIDTVECRFGQFRCSARMRGLRAASTWRPTMSPSPATTSGCAVGP